MRVVQLEEDKKINVFASVTEASKKLNIKRDIILKCCKGKQRTVKGYIFKYLE